MSKQIDAADAMGDVFYPRETLDGRNNYKRYFYIYPDGSINERVYLNIIDKRQREEIICLHYLQLLARKVVQDQIGINVLSRDDPWDFRLELSIGVQFNLEIVSVADSETQFKVLSREEARDRGACEPQITLRQMQKLAKGFPEEELDRLVEQHQRGGLNLDDLVPNPDFSSKGRIYLSSGQPTHESLQDKIDRAILSKEAKRSGGKEETILIIDNRTSVHFIHDATNAFDLLAERIELSPFKEIWFYTGYCSDWDGNNGEYTLIPVKVARETQQILAANMPPKTWPR